MHHLTGIQRSLLKEMEESLPYAFITRQQSLIEQSSQSIQNHQIRPVFLTVL